MTVILKNTSSHVITINDEESGKGYKIPCGENNLAKVPVKMVENNWFVKALIKNGELQKSTLAAYKAQLGKDDEEEKEEDLKTKTVKKTGGK